MVLPITIPPFPAKIILGFHLNSNGLNPKQCLCTSKPQARTPHPSLKPKTLKSLKSLKSLNPKPSSPETLKSP